MKSTDCSRASVSQSFSTASCTSLTLVHLSIWTASAQSNRAVYLGIDPQGQFNLKPDSYFAELGTRSENKLVLVIKFPKQFNNNV